MISVPQREQAIYTGDWNLHHEDWAIDSRASDYRIWLASNGVELLNTT
jgi:hypothetical protein